MEALARSYDALYRLGISHNKFATPLPDGTQYSDYGQVADNRPGEFHLHFNRVRDKEWANCSFLDLGCSEGSTTFRLSERNSTVYGFEGREDGIHRAKALRRILGFDKTRFAVENVDHKSSYRTVDGIFNAGVLYHLADPVLCLERCAAHARSFIYVDTGHLPRSDEEWRTAKYSASLGKPYQIKAHGLTLDVADFTETSMPEMHDGVRRAPRSSIGNPTSLWMAHHSLVELMARLGFPYHEVVRDQPRIPRLRTVFFRSIPRPVSKKLDPLARPLPDLAPDAIQLTRKRDIAYLNASRQPVVVIGRGALVAAVLADLRVNDIEVCRVVDLPDYTEKSMAMLKEVVAVSGPSTLAVAATANVSSLALRLVRLEGYDYVFASFAMAAMNARSMPESS